MGVFMLEKIINLILYSGLDKKSFKLIRDDINEGNRKNIIVFSIVEIVTFSFLIIIGLITQTKISKNVSLYIYYLVALIFIFATALAFSQKCTILINIFVYMLEFSILSLGLYLALVKNPTERTTVYLGILMALPIMFYVKPIGLFLTVSIFNTIYICWAHKVQSPAIFQTNLINVLTFGFASIIAGTYYMATRTGKFNSERLNRILLVTDQMTNLGNRRSYEETLEEFRNEKSPVTIFAFDINGLKNINDLYGHKAGDEVIKGAADCISQAFSPYGKCFRTGGDEFIAILPFEFSEKNAPSRDLLLSTFQTLTHDWRGQLIPKLSISYGHASSSDSSTIDELITKADKLMYAAKAAYHRTNG